MGTEDSWPQPAVAEDSLNDIRLSTFAETDDLHRAAIVGTLRQIDFVASLDQRRPNCQFGHCYLFLKSKDLLR